MEKWGGGEELTGTYAGVAKLSKASNAIEQKGQAFKEKIKASHTAGKVGLKIRRWKTLLEPVYP